MYFWGCKYYKTCKYYDNKSGYCRNGGGNYCGEYADRNTTRL